MLSPQSRSFQRIADGAVACTEALAAACSAPDRVPADEVPPDRAKHRPVGIAAMPDGSLIITDDAGGRVYRVEYKGPAKP